MSKIKNITIAAHVDAGKTTITEQLLLYSGKIRAAGRVDLGTASTDSLAIEKERGISVRSAEASFEYKGCKFNLIDTPGHADFSFEVDRSLSAADGVILALSAAEGIQAHTESLWNALEAASLPAILFINKIDRASSCFKKVLEDLSETFSKEFIPMLTPVNEQSKDCSVIPCDNFYDMLADRLSLYDDGLAESLLEGNEITQERLLESLAICTKKRLVFPVFCGSALYSAGIGELLDGALNLLPYSDEVRAQEEYSLVYGIEHDPKMGRIAHVRTYGASLCARDTVIYPDERESEKISQIRTFSGTKCQDAGSVGRGDTALLCGLSSVSLFDIIIPEGSSVSREKIQKMLEASHKIANPYLSVKAYSESAEISALLSAFRELEAEDPLLSVKWEPGEREIVISITGEMQTEMLNSIIRERYGYDVKFSLPSVIYKETPSQSAVGYECYTMPKPCWAIVKLLIEPLRRGSGVQFDFGSVPHNKLFYKYQEHIKRSFLESLSQGPMGWEVTDIKATLIDGEHHTIHTHPLDFFVATPVAVMNGLCASGTTLLEPMLNVRITIPTALSGRVMADILKMRGEFSSPVNKKDLSVIECRLPVSDSLNYPLELAGASSGKAVYSPSFGGYRALEGEVITTPYRGVDPRDRAKWILYKRGAIQ